MPYDVGYTFCSRPQVHTAAVSYTAPYLESSEHRTIGPADFTLESS